jgi:hypothetical protein
MTTQTSIPDGKRGCGRKAALAIVIVVALLVSVVLYLRQLGPPDIPDPFDVEAFRRSEVASADNAFELYRQAAASLTPMPADQQASYEAAVQTGWPADAFELRQWLEQNGPALDLYRRGSARPDALADAPGTTATGMAPETQALRGLARLARLEALRLEHEGDWAGAADLYRVILRSSRHAGRRGPVLHRMIGVALHALAAESLVRWSVAPEVDAALLRTVLADVRKIDRTTPPLSQALQGEYVSVQLSLDELPWMMFAQIPTTRRVIKLCFENWLSQCDRPRPARMPALPGETGLFQSDPAGPAPRISAIQIEAWSNRAVMAKLLLPSIKQLIEAHDRERSRQGLLELALALQVYHREHGSFPDSLAPLVGAIVDEIPADPFGRGEPLRYRRAADGGATLWSIGPDEVDDDAKINLFSTSGRKGDLVVPLGPPQARPAPE